MKKESLLKKLKSHEISGSIPMHMPGHKRNPEVFDGTLPYGIDITEIAGFDDLHSPESGECLFELSKRAEELYGIAHGSADSAPISAYPLVCGSSGGILAAVRALTIQLRSQGKEPSVIMARNCHKSVWHAVELCRLDAEFLSPSPTNADGIFGEIAPKSVERMMNGRPDGQIVIITSPTYEGIISDVRKIGEIVRRHGGYLVLDAAHGAHLPFMPSNSGRQIFDGADIVITSLHKTLPSLTQTALLLVAGDRVDRFRVARELNVFETSSPSYPLLASIERCLELTEEWSGRGENDSSSRFEAYESTLITARERLSRLNNLKLLHAPSYDIGKLVISTDGAIKENREPLYGTELSDILSQKYNITVEMSAPRHIIAMTSVADMQKNNGGYFSPSIDRFCAALEAIDSTLTRAEVTGESNERQVSIHIPQRAMPAHKAIEHPWGIEYIDLEKAVGRVSGCYVWAYPPGIPIIAPGETVDSSVIEIIREYKKTNATVHILPRTHRDDEGVIAVLKNL